MKKLVLLGTMILLLSGCSKKSDSQSVSGSWYTNSSETISSSSSTVSQTESNEEVTSNNSIYDVVLEKLRNDTSDTPATHYAYYDIDGNGQDELFSGRYWDSTGTIEFAALYYDNNGVADYLAQSYVASAGGYREAANIYTDGTIITAKWTSTGTEMEDTQYQLRADNSGIDIIKSANVPIGKGVELTDYFDVNNKEEFDFSVLDWQTLTTGKVDSEDLNVNQILSGNYESLAGTWINGKGDRLSISANGEINGNATIRSAGQNKYNLVCLSVVPSDNNSTGGFAIGMFPIGTENPLGDNSDTSKPRLIVGQQFTDFPANAYYYRE